MISTRSFAALSSLIASALLSACGPREAPAAAIIAFDTVGIIRAPSASPGFSPEVTELRRYSSGATIVVGSTDLTSFAIYDTTKRFRFWIGGTGNAPGSFTKIRGLAVSKEDTSYLFDPNAQDIQVFDNHLKPVRAIRLTLFPFQAIRLQNGEFVISDPTPRLKKSGVALHVLAPDGTIIRSFGAARDPSVQPQNWARLMRTIDAASDTSFWASERMLGVVDLYGTSGTMQKRITLHGGWITGQLADENAADSVRGMVTRTSVAPDGSLWITALMRPAAIRAHNQTAAPDSNLAAYWILSHVDTGDGHVISYAELPRPCVGITRDGLFVVADYTNDGLRQYILMRPKR